MSEKTYPNAGVNCDYRRYRTGEFPEVGDMVRCHGEAIGKSGVLDVLGNAPFRVRTALDGFIDDQPNSTGWHAARFDLISRAEPAPAEPAAEVFTLQGKHVDWQGVTRDGRKVSVVEFVEWPRANGTTEEACRVRDHQTQWSVRLNGRLRSCAEDHDDVVGPWVEPPPPTLAETVQEYIADMGWLDGLVKNPKFDAMREALERFNLTNPR
jgi:hypothetical protein